MFNLKEVSVTASVSKNYQKAEITMTATVENEEDINALKTVCKEHAVQLLESLPVSEAPKAPSQRPFSAKTDTELAKEPAGQNFNKGGRSVVNQQASQPAGVRPASEAQINYLKSKFGYTGNTNISFAEADYLLKKYKGEI